MVINSLCQSFILRLSCGSTVNIWMLLTGSAPCTILPEDICVSRSLKYKGKSFNCLIDSTTVVVELLLVFIHSCIQPFPIKHCPTVDNEIPSDDDRQTSFPFHAPPFPVCSWERKLHITFFIKLFSSLLKLRSMTQIPSLYTLWTCNTMMVTVIDNYSRNDNSLYGFKFKFLFLFIILSE